MTSPTGSFDTEHSILFTDEHLLIVNKPAGLLAVPGRGVDKQDCLISRVQQLYPDALAVHRLDMATSGLMVIARGKAVQRLLSIAFENRVVKRKYIAKVAGIPKESEGEIALPLSSDWPNRPKQKVCFEQGKDSLTLWQLLNADENSNTALLELSPHTGRTHQLRVHLISIDHPILGDALYAPEEWIKPYLRLMLHASELSFQHPMTQELLDFKNNIEF